MNVISVLFMYLVILFTNYILFICYKKLDKNLKFYSIKNIIILFISSIVMVLNFYLVSFFNRPVITYLLYLICLKIIYKKNNSDILIKGSFIYLVYMIFDFIYSILLLLYGEAILNVLDSDILVKSLYTLCVILTTLLVFSLSFVKKFANKLYNLYDRKIIMYFLINILLLFVIISSINFSEISNFMGYGLCSLFIFIVVIMFVEATINKIIVNKKIKENDILLDFLDEYENINDNNSECKHEMLNNLLILKSYKNKNTKEYNNLLDSLIDLYNNKSDIMIKNISKLPKGIKWILYYKVSAMKSKGINVSFKISRSVNNHLKNIDSKNYYDISKIIGIFMDNACEASYLSDKKYIFIDVYLLSEYIVFNIENSVDKKVDIEMFKLKRYTTKGKNHGIGLDVVKTILNRNNNIVCEFEFYDDRFVSIVKIKKS